MLTVFIGTISFWAVGSALCFIYILFCDFCACYMDWFAQYCVTYEAFLYMGQGNERHILEATTDG